MGGRAPNFRFEHTVDHVQDLGARAEVRVERGPRPDFGQLRAPALEQVDVRVPEAVDRLLGVADREQVRGREQLDQLELDLVGVLELVDHDPGEPRPVALAQLATGAQELAALELEILEVKARDLALGAREPLLEQPE